MSVPHTLFEQGHILVFLFVSFNVVSLFTNVTLSRTIKIILQKKIKMNQSLQS